MKLIKSWDIPIITVSEANMYENPYVANRRHKVQKKRIHLFMNDIKKNNDIYKDKQLTVKLTRFSTRKLDEHDNLRMAFKYIVDAIADLIYPGKALGRADDSKLLEWKYAQEKGKNKIKIEIFEHETSSLHVTNHNIFISE